MSSGEASVKFVRACVRVCASNNLLDFELTALYSRRRSVSLTSISSIYIVPTITFGSLARPLNVWRQRNIRNSDETR